MRYLFLCPVLRSVTYCLVPCNPSTTPYCISKALINAAYGDIDNGLIFCGSNAYRIDKIVPVSQLIDELIS